MTEKKTSRRDFLGTLTIGAGTIGGAVFVVPVAQTFKMNTSKTSFSDALIDLNLIEEGMRITTIVRGKPVFVAHRTTAEIEKAKADDIVALPDPELDSVRIKAGCEKWLVVVGICTHLGCVPTGQKTVEPRGDYGGWFCPCHGSHFDVSGRIRKGPATKNLAVPNYNFLPDNILKIG